MRVLPASEEGARSFYLTYSTCPTLMLELELESDLNPVFNEQARRTWMFEEVVLHTKIFMQVSILVSRFDRVGHLSFDPNRS